MLSADVSRYVDTHRALGFKYRTQDLLLRNFAVFAEARGDTVVRIDRALEWAGKAPSAAQQRNRLLTVRRFAIAMRLEFPDYEIPPADAFGHTSFRRKIIHIYSSEEIAQLIDAALQLKSHGSLRPLTYATLFALLASTGLRISEALALTANDITNDGLIIRDTKFRKSRLVPLHETVRDGLDSYLVARARVASLEPVLFVSSQGKALPHSTVNGVFLKLARAIGLRAGPGQCGPRLHDFRHTFAVRSLEQCSGDKQSIARHLYALSTYLGHAQVTYTYWYLQATPILMAEISAAGEALHKGGIT